MSTLLMLIEYLFIQMPGLSELVVKRILYTLLNFASSHLDSRLCATVSSLLA